ncbi:MAG: Nif3-like dinuclear metal center hexameric protein [Phycisphaerae bacterium]
MTARGGTSVTVGAVAAAMDQIAPPALAQSWDNVGLLVGDRKAACRRVLLCIDLTPAVLRETVAAGCEMIVSYHPPLLKPVKRIVADSDGTESIVHEAIRRGIAIYSPHTALDAAEGGVNDVLAGLCGLKDVGPFEYVSVGRQEYKVVTFVPFAQLEKVASAMFAAGAGRIGDYEQCSYRLRGEGTFFGTESTHPQVGRKGQLERVAETRIEMICVDRCLPEVIAALRRSHPYEEPAFDIYPLTPEPEMGIGRVGVLPKGTTLGSLAKLLKRATKSQVMMAVGAANTKLRRAAVCAGAAGRLPMEKPRSADCDVIITGEIRHHDALSILRAGKTAIALGHWESERPALAPLAQRLRRAVGSIGAVVSRKDAPPFHP